MTTERRGWAATVLAAAACALTGCPPSYQVAPPARMTVDAMKAVIDARAALFQAAEDGDPVTRMQALEALAATVGAKAGGVFTEALNDANPAVRFAAATAIGDAKYEPAGKKLLELAKPGVADKRVFCAVVYALYRVELLDSHPEHGTTLGELVSDREPEVRANAALMIGKMGEPSASSLLKAALADEYDQMVRLNLVEALARLEDRASAAALESYTKGYFLDLRLAAIPALAEAGDARAPQVLEDLLAEREPPRVRVAAAGALGRLGHFNERGYRLCIAAVRKPRTVLAHAFPQRQRFAPVEVASLQQIATRSLGSMGQTPAVDVLVPLLDSTAGSVRVAAGMSILRLLGDRTVEPPSPTTRPETAAASRPAGLVPKLPKLHTAGGKD